MNRRHIAAAITATTLWLLARQIRQARRRRLTDTRVAANTAILAGHRDRQRRYAEYTPGDLTGKDAR